MSLPEDMGSFDALVWVVARLRAPDGCPWDRVQSHATLRRYLLSECYEVLEALDEADPGKLRAELGDLLMQVVIHARIAQETGEFELADVIRGISTKLIRRHPHVFGSTRVGSEEEVYLNWEELKREERGADASILESVPGELPALGYAQEIQDRVARVGFDWADISGVIDKLGEEVTP